MIKTKRIYEAPDRADGYRILVDRLWPRGVSKEAAQLDLWLKDIAPSNELRKWYHEQQDQWEEFKEKYFAELSEMPDVVKRLKNLAREHETITLLYSSKNTTSNNAIALKEYLLS